MGEMDIALEVGVEADSMVVVVAGVEFLEPVEVGGQDSLTTLASLSFPPKSQVHLLLPHHSHSRVLHRLK